MVFLEIFSIARFMNTSGNLKIRSLQFLKNIENFEGYLCKFIFNVLSAKSAIKLI